MITLHARRKKLDYEFWKDFATILSYIALIFGALNIHSLNKLFPIIVFASSIVGITYCTYKMIIHKITD